MKAQIYSVRTQSFNKISLALLLASTALIWSRDAAAQEAQICSTRYVQTFGSSTSLPQTTTSNAAVLGPALAASGEGESTYPYGYDAGTNTIIRGAGYYYRLTNPRDHQSWTGWLDATDHTGDTGGYFLMYDGYMAGSVAYSYEFSGLVAGSSYSASVWIANIFNAAAEDDVGGYAAPNITVRIVNADTDAVVSSVETGNIPSASGPVNGKLPWTQYSFSFQASPSLTNARLEIVNNTNAPYGADFAIDDVSIIGDCRPAPPVAIPAHPVPANSPLGLMTLATSILSLGGWLIRRRRS
ncbi:hypothetical protein [Ottowia thiooxydans]|uniref:IPTL-CTERM protein sorting domain-containing protein n=1 Tax=Ottowia thiooxydans TaxID=219182 RepID=A0ABV2QGZ2_9BURK